MCPMSGLFFKVCVYTGSQCFVLDELKILTCEQKAEIKGTYGRIGESISLMLASNFRPPMMLHDIIGNRVLLIAHVYSEIAFEAWYVKG